MWICLNNAFLSIVSPAGTPKDSLLVRARRKGDIERAFGAKSIAHLVKHTPLRDYAYRAEMPREMVAGVIELHVRGIAYGNFKSSVRDDALHSAYNRVWGVMLGLQATAPLSGARRAGKSAQDRLFDSDTEVLPANLDAVERQLAKPKAKAKPAAKKAARAPRRLRAPGLDDGESPFHPIPGLSSAGEY